MKGVRNGRSKAHCLTVDRYRHSLRVPAMTVCGRWARDMTEVVDDVTTLAPGELCRVCWKGVT